MEKAGKLENSFELPDLDSKVFAYGYVAFSIARDLVEDFVGRYGLSIGEHTMLWHLRVTKGEVNLKEVKDSTYVYSGASITKVADKLLHKGYITRRENPASRREKLVKITPAGTKVCVQVLKNIRKVYGSFFSAFPATEKRKMLKHFSTFLDTVLKLREEA